MAKLRLEKPFFFSASDGIFGRILSDDTRRIVYELIKCISGDGRKQYSKGPHNRTLKKFFEIYPDAKFLTEQEYLFETLRHDS